MAGAVDFKATGDTRDAVREFQKLMKKQDQVLDKMKKTGKASRGARKDSAGWTSAATASFAGMAAGLVTVNAAAKIYNMSLGLIKDTLTQINAERSRAATGIMGAEFAVAKLSQLAGGDPARMKRMTEAATASRLQAGMPMTMAANLQYQLESGGLAGARKMFAGLHQTFGGDVSGTVKGVTLLQSAMGKGETGSAKEIINKIMAAQGPTPYGPSQLLPAMTIPAQAMKAIGASDEELMAATSIASMGAKSLEIGATQINALAREFGKKGLDKGGLLGGIEMMQRKGITGRRVQKFLGSEEAVAGYRYLSANIQSVRDLQAKITEAGGLAGTDKSLVAGMLRVAGGEPKIAAALAYRQAEQAAAEGEETAFGVPALKRKTAVKRTVTRTVTLPYHRRLPAQKLAGMVEWVGGSPEEIRSGEELGKQLPEIGLAGGRLLTGDLGGAMKELQAVAGKVVTALRARQGTGEGLSE